MVLVADYRLQAARVLNMRPCLTDEQFGAVAALSFFLPVWNGVGVASIDGAMLGFSRKVLGFGLFVIWYTYAGGFVLRRLGLRSDGSGNHWDDSPVFLSWSRMTLREHMRAGQVTVSLFLARGFFHLVVLRRDFAFIKPYWICKVVAMEEQGRLGDRSEGAEAGEALTVDGGAKAEVLTSLAVESAALPVSLPGSAALPDSVALPVSSLPTPGASIVPPEEANV